MKTKIWTRAAVIYKRQLQQDRFLSVEYSCKRQGIGHSSHRLDPGQSEVKLMCPMCFADWARSEQGPTSAEIKLGEVTW